MNLLLIIAITTTLLLGTSQAKPLDTRQISTLIGGFIGDNVIQPFIDDISPGLSTSLISILQSLQGSFTSNVPLLIGKRDLTKTNLNVFTNSLLQLKERLSRSHEYTIENFIDDFKILLFSELLSILLNISYSEFEKLQLIQQTISNAQSIAEDLFSDILGQVLNEINLLGTQIVSGTNLSINQILSQIGK